MFSTPSDLGLIRKGVNVRIENGHTVTGSCENAHALVGGDEVVENGVGGSRHGAGVHLRK